MNSIYNFMLSIAIGYLIGMSYMAGVSSESDLEEAKDFIAYVTT